MQAWMMADDGGNITHACITTLFQQQEVPV
jgi:hypothetical protein